MGKKILLIDDSAMLRRIAASVLGAQPARYEVLAATRATEGFARACNSGVDLILADQRLCVLPGDDLTRRLLTEPRTARIPVVLLIGRGYPVPPLETLPANVIEVLGKPFSPDQLVTLVNTITELTSHGTDLARLRAKLHPGPKSLPEDTPFRAVVQEAPPSPAVKPIPRAAPPMVANSGKRESEAAPSQFLFRRDVGAMSIRSTLQHVAKESLHGVLRFRPPGAAPTEIFIEGGHLVIVATRDAVTYSEGALNVLPPKVSPATLEGAVLEQSRQNVPFFLTLGSYGLLSKAVAEMMMHQFGQRYFARLWSVKPSLLVYEFEPMHALPGFVMRLTPRRESVDEWLLGTLRSVTTADLMDLSRHEGLLGTPFLREGGATILQTLPLTAEERDFVHAVTGRATLPALGKRLGISAEAAFRLLHRFRSLDAMDYRPAPAAFLVTPRTSLRRVLPLER